MFFEPLCKGSRGFTNVLLITVNPATLKSIDDPTLFEDWIFILWGHQEAFDGSTSFEVHLYTMFVTGLFKALTHTLVIGYHHVGLWALVVIASVGAHCSFLLGLRSQLGKSSRTFAERFKEHQKAPSPIFDHSNISGHQVNIDNFNIVGREDLNLSRTIKEALYIRVNNPSLNKNIGKYHLPHIWDEVLLNTSELKLK